MKFHLIFQFTDDGISARSIDFPEIQAVGRTVTEVEDQMHDAIREHIEALQAQHKWDELFQPRAPAATTHQPALTPHDANRR